MNSLHRVLEAFAAALVDVMLRHGRSLPTAYFWGYGVHLQQATEQDMFDRLEKMVKEVEEAVPGAWAHAKAADTLRESLKRNLPNATPVEIAYGAKLLARWPGGDAATFATTWGAIP